MKIQMLQPKMVWNSTLSLHIALKVDILHPFQLKMSNQGTESLCRDSIDSTLWQEDLWTQTDRQKSKKMSTLQRAQS